MSFGKALNKSKSLLGAVPLFGLATGALFPITALHLQDLGSDPAFIGLVTTVYYCGSFLAAMTFGKILTKVGYRAGFATSALVAAGATYSLTLVEGQSSWLLLRFIGGFSLGAYYVVVDGWFQALADRRSRGTLFATYETVRLAATALGPFLLVLGSVYGSIVIVDLAYLASIAPALLTEEPNGGRPKSYDFSGLVETARCFPAALLVAACGGIANSSFYGLSALYASGVGFSVESIAFFVAFVLAAPAVSEIPLGALADRFTRMGVAVSCAATALAASLVLILFQTPPLLLACLGGAVVGGAMVPMYAFGLSRIVDGSRETETVEATSAGLIAYNLGAFAGPVLAGVSIATFGAVGLYVFLSLVASVAFLSALADIKFTRCCPEPAAM
ncbi:MAG: MFS transporter [Geminicoccaceae bacterium]